MDRGAWQVTVHGAAKSWTRLRDFHFHFTFLCVLGLSLYIWNFSVTVLLKPRFKDF